MVRGAARSHSLRPQVTWVVFEAPISVPPSQVVAYQAFLGQQEHSLSLNARPLQPLNGRPVKRVSVAANAQRL